LLITGPDTFQYFLKQVILGQIMHYFYLLTILLSK